MDNNIMGTHARARARESTMGREKREMQDEVWEMNHLWPAQCIRFTLQLHVLPDACRLKLNEESYE